MNLTHLNKYLIDKTLKFKDLQNTTISQPLLRTYVKYKRGKSQLWTETITKTVTNNKLRFIIPLGNGLVMLSYTDGKDAKFWYNKIKTLTQKELLNKYIKEVFPDKKISENPLYIKNYYWDQGVSYWKVGCDSEKMIPIINNPLELPLYICGDSFSNRQEWMEGALESSNNIFKLIKNHI